MSKQSVTKLERLPHHLLRLSEKWYSKHRGDIFGITCDINDLQLSVNKETKVEPQVISLCQQYRARLACTTMRSDKALCCWLTHFKFSS